MRAIIATAITVAAAASAQSYSTSVYTDCTSLPDATITSYNTETLTYCSECEGGMTAKPGQYMHTTIWTTELYDFCPTGLSAYTVTITESCTDATPTWSPGQSNYVPQGYTTSEMTCDVCGETPITRVMTYPTGSPPAYPPAGPAAPTPARETSPATIPGAGQCPGPECKAPYPTATPGSGVAPESPASQAACTGVGCGAPSSGATTLPAPASNSSNSTPYTGAASGRSPQISSFFAFLIGAVINYVLV